MNDQIICMKSCHKLWQFWRRPMILIILHLKTITWKLSSRWKYSFSNCFMFIASYISHIQNSIRIFHPRHENCLWPSFKKLNYNSSSMQRKRKERQHINTHFRNIILLVYFNNKNNHVTSKYLMTHISIFLQLIILSFNQNHPKRKFKWSNW